jgi:prepilin signal peptidase PulO-like enzyme (type II secretory pathway)
MSIFDVPLYENMPWQYTILFVYIGATIGSFFNVLALRWPRYQLAKNDAESAFWLSIRGHGSRTTQDLSSNPLPALMSGRSICPSCSKKIPIYFNLPIISWLMLMGKSRCCRKPIKIRYLAYELFGALTFLAIAMTTGPSVTGLLLGMILMVLSLCAILDYEEGFIPENLLFVGFFLSYAFSMSPLGIGLENAFTSHALVFFSLFIPFHCLGKIMGRELVGTSDFHLIALCATLIVSIIPIALIFWPFAIATWWTIKNGAKRGIFVHVVGSSAIPAAPAIVAAVFIIIGVDLVKLS